MAHTGCPLIAVMGHTNCGAVAAAVHTAQHPEFSETPHVDEIVRRLLPAVLATRKDDEEEWIFAASQKNVVLCCRAILSGSGLIAEKVARKEIGVVGLWYDLDSGAIEKQ